MMVSWRPGVYPSLYSLLKMSGRVFRACILRTAVSFWLMTLTASWSSCTSWDLNSASSLATSTAWMLRSCKVWWKGWGSDATGNGEWMSMYLYVCVWWCWRWGMYECCRSNKLLIHISTVICANVSGLKRTFDAQPVTAPYTNQKSRIPRWRSP